jgi:hypothetical protein
LEKPFFDFFFQTLTILARSKEVSLAKSENNSGWREEESVRKKRKTLTRLAIIYLFFYSPSLDFTHI